MKLDNMTLRALSGAVYVALIVACCLLGPWWFFGLCLLFSLLGLNELGRLLDARAPYTTAARACDMVLAASILTGAYGLLAGQDTFLLCWLYLPLYLPLRMCVAVGSHAEAPARSAAMSMFAVCYTALPLVMLLTAYFIGGSLTVLATFVMIWLNDTGAYLSGRAFGRRKLCERLSPKKTWEGFWGGFAACVVAGALCPLVIYPSVPGAPVFIIWAVYGAIVSGAATVGDLFESLIKRTVGVKDSGNLIPGHGGLLDRIDSLLAVAPLTMLLAIILVGACNIHALSGV